MIKKYREFMVEGRQDEILDKILSHGIESLTDDEKRFLDAHKDDNQEEVGKELDIKDGRKPLESDDMLFEFDMESVDVYEKEGISVKGSLTYYGSLYYGKFEFNQYKEFEYWMFTPANKHIEDDEPDSNIWELEYKLDDNNHAEAFDIFSKKVYKYYVEDIDMEAEFKDKN